MKVICHKCQYENHSSSSQVFCARCATMIDVRGQRESGPDEGYRSGSPLPYGGRAGAPYDSVPGGIQHGTVQSGDPLPIAGSNSPQTARPGRARDAYATRVGDDFNDLLEINTVGDGQLQAWDTPLPDGNRQISTPWPDRPSPDRQGVSHRDESGVGLGIGYGDQSIQSIRSGQSSQSGDGGGQGGGRYADESRTSMGGAGRAGRETREFSDEAQANLTGWPVLTDSEGLGYDDDEESEDDVTTRQGMGMRVLLGVAVFAGLIGGAYFFLGDLISKRRGQAESLPAAVAEAPSSAPSQTPGADQSSTAASTVATPTPATGESSTAALPSVAGYTPFGVGDRTQPVDIPPMAGRGSTQEPPRSTPPTPEPDRDATRSIITPSVPSSGNWTIQIASFNDQGQAGDRVADLKAASLPARISRVDIPGKGTWYRVQIGGFESREEALRYGGQLRSRGAIQDFIATPK